MVGGLLMATVETSGGAGLAGGGANDFVAAGLVQFSAGETGSSGSLMVSAGGGVVAGGDAQPARKISAPQKMIPANLNTHQLCGTEIRTQAVSSSVLPALVPELIFSEDGEESIVCFPACLFVARGCGMIFQK
jgi:hypothetical protein